MKSSCIQRLGASLGIILVVGFAFTLAAAASTSAQVVSDPRVAEFDPSPDHWQVLDSGDPAVVRYELGVYVLGGAAPVATADMGKPAPGSDGKIRYDFSSQLAAWQLSGGDYEARVSAVGPEGAAMSDPSNPFTFTTDATPCTFSLNASKVSAPASGGTYGVDVVTGSGCKWDAVSALPWVDTWAGGGSGSGTLAFEVEPNSSTTGRTGTIDVAGQTLTVSQYGAPETCSYSVSPTSATVDPAAGGSPVFTVTAGAGCTWTARPSEGWITVASDMGSGTGTVPVTVAPNPSTSTRTGTVTVEGHLITITQAGTAPNCKYTVTPTVFSVSAAGDSGLVEVTTDAGCAWTVSSSESWLVPAVTGGTNTATFSFTAKQNNGITNRQGTLTVGPWAVTVFQSGKPRRTK